MKNSFQTLLMVLFLGSLVICNLNSNSNLSTAASSNSNANTNLLTSSSKSETGNKFESTSSNKSELSSTSHTEVSSQNESKLKVSSSTENLKSSLLSSNKISLNMKSDLFLKFKSQTQKSENGYSLFSNLGNLSSNKLNFKFMSENKSKSKSKLSNMFKDFLKTSSNNRIKQKELVTLKLKEGALRKGNDPDINLNQKTIFWEGWIKYIKLTNVTSVVKPSNFFVNKDFFNQHIRKDEVMLRDEKSKFVNIVSQFHFFAKLSTHTLNILTSRNAETGRNTDSLIVDLIGPISENEKLRYSGSVQPLGEFKEGYCMQVFTFEETPSGSTNPNPTTGFSYVICTDSLIERDTLVEYLIDLKLKYQRLNPIDGNIKAENLLKADKVSDVGSSNGGSDNLSRGTTTSPNDGRWILLQDWSQCSKKCGGGLQYQQWMCVPPKPNGKPCEGDSVLNRECNSQPCPTYGIGDHNNFKAGDKTLKPIIKSLPFSQRPQQRILCKIREGDVLFDSEEEINGVKVTMRMPARLVLNTRTISLFQDDNYIKSAFNFPLNQTKVAGSLGNHCCVLIKSQKKTFNVCGGFGTNCGTKENPEFVNSWIQDFNLFKTKCFVPLKDQNWAQNQDEKVVEEQLNQMKLDIVNDTEDMLNKKLDKQKDAAALASVRKTQDTAVKVLKKEFNLEEMLAKEEQLRALNETKELLVLKKSEEKKKECLEQALKSKQEEQKKKRENLILLKSVDAVKEETQKEVEEQRDLLKKRIAAIRGKSNRRNRQIKREINIIRSQMAQGLMEADKIGDKEKCVKSLGNEEMIKSYCDDHINLTPQENNDCKDKERFCYVCCETEFGAIHVTERELCYNSCDELVKVNGKGEWVWEGKRSQGQTNDNDKK